MRFGPHTQQTKDKIAHASRLAWKRNYKRRKAASRVAIAAMQKAMADPVIEKRRRRRIKRTMRALGIGVGEINNASKITAQCAARIRDIVTSGATQTATARYMGVSRRLVGFIVSGERWANTHHGR